MRTPFAFFGNKKIAARLLWARFGDPKYYYAPFAGALGCLLNRPPFKGLRYEYVGDIDANITNFWRAAKWAPDELAKWAEWQPNEIDLKARMQWLASQNLQQALLDDPQWFDAKIAAWYAWCQCGGISKGGTVIRQGRKAGIHCDFDLVAYFRRLAQRLRHVTVFHLSSRLSWLRMAFGAGNMSKRDVAICLDPPYGERNGTQRLYDCDDLDVAARCRKFCQLAERRFPRLKMALCGYAGEHDLPGWDCVPWESHFGKGFERIWFSPSCQ